MVCEKLVCIGVVGRPHGVLGGVHIFPYTESSEFFGVNSVVHINDCEYKVMSCFKKKSQYIVKLDGIDSRMLALQLNQKKVFVPRSCLKDVEDESVYVCDLMNIDVYSMCGKKIGIVSAVEDYGAGVFLSIALEQNKIATIQFNKKAVISIEKQYIVIDEKFLIL